VSTPRVSVLLPCRNAADHLPQAIQSLRMQTLPDFEVVAVNDGSTDGTGDVLERWAVDDRRVRVIDTEGVPTTLLTHAAWRSRSPFWTPGPRWTRLVRMCGIFHARRSDWARDVTSPG
jgi:cellulose synthase/poly-beta-1,6-N-acetylglucosamine synthase-like glycosyltransferase